MRAHNLPSDTFRALLDADYGAEMAEKENMRTRFTPFVEYTDSSEITDGLHNGTVIGGKLESNSNEKNGSSLRHEHLSHLDVDGAYRCKTWLDRSRKGICFLTNFRWVEWPAMSHKTVTRLTQSGFSLLAGLQSGMRTCQRSVWVPNML
ncbi:hypothetical protein FBUS_06076 [Fasciolopsis buskii]|uniref:Uncharacterized protein n=1 Tax=Fasciolopsis buskii TaxID=27845 RepID=A0A8E0S5Z9_9TREM|nr:hypothetical protein FBUS_06076 [Fasciolopsis buski]